MPKRNVVAISLPDQLLEKLSEEAKKMNTSRSDVVRRSLLKLFAIRDFNAARNKSINELTLKNKSFSDEDIYDEIS